MEALVADRAARLSEDERDALVWSAAFGRAVRPELLAACMGLGEGALMARLDRLIRHGLLRPTEDGQLDFAHDLVRQGVYRLQSQPHRRVLHRQIARVLSTVVDGFHRSHRYQVVGDAVACRRSGVGDAAFYKQSVVNVIGNFARVVRSDDLTSARGDRIAV